MRTYFSDRSNPLRDLKGKQSNRSLGYIGSRALLQNVLAMTDCMTSEANERRRNMNHVDLTAPNYNVLTFV